MAKGLISKIKQNVANTGANKGKILGIRDGDKVRIRFLQDMDEGYEFVFHDNYTRNINSLCLEHVGKDCPLCNDDDVRTRDNYAWSVYDHDAKQVKVMLFAANGISPLQQLLDYYEANNNTITDRDYIIKRTGKGIETKWTVMPQDKSKFRNEKAKPYSEEGLIKLLAKAFPYKDAGDDDDDDDEEDEVEETPKKKAGKKNIKDDVKKAKKDEDEDEIDVEWIETLLEKNDIDEDEFCEFRDIPSLKTLVKKGYDKKKIKSFVKEYIESLDADDEEDEDDDE